MPVIWMDGRGFGEPEMNGLEATVESCRNRRVSAPDRTTRDSCSPCACRSHRLVCCSPSSANPSLLPRPVFSRYWFPPFLVLYRVPVPVSRLPLPGSCASIATSRFRRLHRDATDVCLSFLERADARALPYQARWGPPQARAGRPRGPQADRASLAEVRILLLGGVVRVRLCG